MPNHLDGVCVVSFESRRSQEMAILIKKQGGIALSAPSMQEAALEAQKEAQRFAQSLASDTCDGLILLTGVGARLLFKVLTTELGAERVAEIFRRVPCICRGPKPIAILKEFNVVPKAVAPEPNTWRELLPLLGELNLLKRQRLSIQEYGAPALELAQALREAGASVSSVPVYGWRLPDNLEPLKRAIKEIVAGRVQAALFTAAQQVEHLMQVAEQMGVRSALEQQLNEELVIASIGPVTSAALARRGLLTNTHPDHPKMGLLVSHLARNWAQLSPSTLDALPGSS